MEKMIDKVTREQWSKMGAEVKVAQLVLSYLYNDVATHLGKTNQSATRLWRAMNELNKVQSYLDDDVCHVDTYKHIYSDNISDPTPCYVFYGDYIDNQKEDAMKFVTNIVNRRGIKEFYNK